MGASYSLSSVMAFLRLDLFSLLLVLCAIFRPQHGVKAWKPSYRCEEFGACDGALAHVRFSQLN